MATITTRYVPGTAYQTNIETAELTLTGDEPVASGGDGAGPSPYEFLLASLGHCTVLTMILYARRKAWQIDNVSVRGTFERITTGDPVTGRTRTERITQDMGKFGFGSEGTPPQIIGAVAAYLATHPDEAAAFNGKTVEGQPYCFEKGLVPGWQGPGFGL